MKCANNFFSFLHALRRTPIVVKSGGIKGAKNVVIEIQPLGTGDLKT